ncbi:MAG TPA: hypothetical protein VKP64_07030 [Mycobacteriales bacterium]|nr:hypothetical protein [Mycobacteriales bacterium]
MTGGAEFGDEPPDLRLVGPALATWLAVLVAWELPGPEQAFALAVILLLAAMAAAAAALRSAPPAAVVAAALVCAAAGVVGVATRSATVHAGPVTDLAARRAMVETTVVITSDPEQREGRIRFGRAVALVVVQARMERVDAAGRTLRLRAPVLVLATGPAWLRLLPGTKVRLEGWVLPPNGSDPLAAVVAARGSPKRLALRPQEPASVRRPAALPARAPARRARLLGGQSRHPRPARVPRPT